MDLRTAHRAELREQFKTREKTPGNVSEVLQTKLTQRNLKTRKNATRNGAFPQTDSKDRN